MFVAVRLVVFHYIPHGDLTLTDIWHNPGPFYPKSRLIYQDCNNDQIEDAIFLSESKSSEGSIWRIVKLSGLNGRQLEPMKLPPTKDHPYQLLATKARLYVYSNSHILAFPWDSSERLWRHDMSQLTNSDQDIAVVLSSDRDGDSNQDLLIYDGNDHAVSYLSGETGQVLDQWPLSGTRFKRMVLADETGFLTIRQDSDSKPLLSRLDSSFNQLWQHPGEAIWASRYGKHWLVTDQNHRLLLIDDSDGQVLWQLKLQPWRPVSPPLVLVNKYFEVVAVQLNQGRPGQYSGSKLLWLRLENGQIVSETQQGSYATGPLRTLNLNDQAYLVSQSFLDNSFGDLTSSEITLWNSDGMEPEATFALAGYAPSLSSFKDIDKNGQWDLINFQGGGVGRHFIENETVAIGPTKRVP